MLGTNYPGQDRTRTSKTRRCLYRKHDRCMKEGGPEAYPEKCPTANPRPRSSFVQASSIRPDGHRRHQNLPRMPSWCFSSLHRCMYLVRQTLEVGHPVEIQRVRRSVGKGASCQDFSLSKTSIHISVENSDVSVVALYIRGESRLGRIEPNTERQPTFCHCVCMTRRPVWEKPVQTWTKTSSSLAQVLYAGLVKSTRVAPTSTWKYQKSPFSLGK